ncbi:YncE family protein [Pantoea dispersa]|uniref:YncE family protein n=1 Tax=Pantoea dispersa TaxID=59814 RepID=UPI001BA74378|nr:YncE family protein [Pantoea dispersa]MBS0897051.1 YncE family protein [Pantoea dispersa]
MTSSLRPRATALALALLAAMSLSACQAPAKKSVAPAAAAKPAAAEKVQQRELGDGLYEMAYVPGDPAALYVASAQAFKTVNGGVLYRLDARTLATLGETHTDLKNFGMTASPDGSVLYITNTLDGGVTKVDARSGKVLQRLLFGLKNDKGNPVGAREILLHDGLLYIGAIENPAMIWVVDANTLRLKTTIKNAGKWVTGLLYSASTDRIYAANGSGEVLVINPRSHKIEQRWTPGDGKEYLLLNLAEDAANGRLYVTDNSKGKTTLVFDERSGKVIKRLDVGDSLGIKFNAKRNEIYISQRLGGKVLQLDATTYAVKNSWTLPAHPNSLLVSPDGQTLYVTVKQGLNKDRSPQGPDSVVRITLD